VKALSGINREGAQRIREEEFFPSGKGFAPSVVQMSPTATQFTAESQFVRKIRSAGVSPACAPLRQQDRLPAGSRRPQTEIWH